MSQKQDRKIRQLFRRKYRDEFFKQIIQGKFLNQFLRPKPKWCPQFLWIFLLKLVINLDFKDGNKKNQNQGDKAPAKQP